MRGLLLGIDFQILVQIAVVSPAASILLLEALLEALSDGLLLDPRLLQGLLMAGITELVDTKKGILGHIEEVIARMQLVETLLTDHLIHNISALARPISSIYSNN